MSSTVIDNNPVGIADVPSWDEIVRLHSAQVYRLAYRLTGNRCDAEDLSQDVFLRVFRRLSTYSPGNFEGWLHQLTTNLFLDQRRQELRRCSEVMSEGIGNALTDPRPTPDVVLEEKNFEADVQAALDSLGVEFRAAIVLRDVEGLPYGEVAEALGIKVGTVSSRLHRGRGQLRMSLAHRAPDPISADSRIR